MTNGEHCSKRTKPIAIGVAPMGTVAIGIVPMGVVSIGVVPMGVVSIGVVAICHGYGEPSRRLIEAWSPLVRNGRGKKPRHTVHAQLYSTAP